MTLGCRFKSLRAPTIVEGAARETDIFRRYDELSGIRHPRSIPVQSPSHHERLPAHQVPAVPAAALAAGLVAGLQGLSNHEATAQNGSSAGEQGELTNPRAI